MTADEAGWALVGEWLQQELDSQGLSLARVARDSGVAYQTLRKLLDGQAITRRDRMVALARALGYEHDAFERVRAGREPVRIPLANGDRITAVETRLDRIEEAVQELLDRGAP